MLKIKDNVDLKELEKFGFRYLDDFYYFKNERKRNVGLVIYKDNYKTKGFDRCLKFVTMDTQSLDSVYDLIQAGLVEKVKEE